MRRPPKSALQSLPLLTLCRLNVCAGMRWLPGQDGMAGYAPRFRRLGLPALNVSDANAGLNLRRPNVGFPASSVIAATFNRAIAESVGRVVAEECPGHGVDLVLAPGMNLHRSPLCGRHPEYFSEDPYLAGKMAAGYCMTPNAVSKQLARTREKLKAYLNERGYEV